MIEYYVVLTISRLFSISHLYWPSFLFLFSFPFFPCPNGCSLYICFFLTSLCSSIVNASSFIKVSTTLHPPLALNRLLVIANCLYPNKTRVTIFRQPVHWSSRILVDWCRSNDNCDSFDDLLSCFFMSASSCVCTLFNLFLISCNIRSHAHWFIYLPTHGPFSSGYCSNHQQSDIFYKSFFNLLLRMALFSLWLCLDIR